MRKTREFTNKILEAIEDGMLDRNAVILACLSYMSEDAVKDMAEANELFPEEDEEEEWTPDNADYCDFGSRHHY